MMKLACLCIYDLKAETYFTPYFQTTINHAERSFRDEVNRPAEDNILYKHPEDFELHFLGFFDTADGKFEFKHKVICTGRQALKPLPEDKAQLKLTGVN